MSDDKRNVYQKLQACRVALQSEKMAKSGHNKFAGYYYFELGDFLPTINRLFNENGLCSIVRFDEIATLEIVNMDKPDEKITFVSPMSTAALKGCHEIQNLGAVETYLRRYLYVAALEIVEHDALDAVTGDKNGEPEPTSAPKPSPAKVEKKLSMLPLAKQASEIAASFAFTNADIKDACMHKFNSPFGKLTEEQQTAYIEELKFKRGLFAAMKSSIEARDYAPGQDAPEAELIDRVFAWINECVAQNPALQGKPLRASESAWEDWKDKLDNLVMGE